ncbi:endonuclease/exonuclease/phosphatase family protein [Streptomyces sp. CC224E]|uniref:endonuclease/exonuclease/phosphatase family protein n=1 Tax=Streptomyces sp. CC224E TaxID=3044174 RepID=UPI00278C0820|nr:endonuclease/exonuclease/phosphatase family protein [Streptomyces sp. CC224E]
MKPSKYVPSRWRLAALTVACATVSGGALVAVPAAHAADVAIHDIQGATRISPLAGQQVTGVTGVVTGARTYGSSRGFWFQDTKPDADPATSEGLFVFTSSTPTVKAGDAVTVSGTVSEYVPGGASSGNQSLTELTKPTVTVNSSGNPVPVTAISDKSVPDAYAPQGDPAANGSVNKLPLRPRAYALDYYESLEGQNVRVGTSRVVTASDEFGELWVTVKPHQNRTKRGGTRYASYEDQNGGRLQIQSLGALADFPKADVGDALTGTTEGPLDFNQYGGYTLVARELGTLEQSGGVERETTRAQQAGELAVATYNVENLDPTDTTFDAHAAAIVGNLRSPDIVSLEEIQDNNGAKNDGTVAADVTMGKLIDAIVAAGGPRYDWRSVDPVNNKDGGEPGGNIRQVFLFNPDRVSFTDRPGGDATTPVGVTAENGEAALTASPGRVDPANTAWSSSRKPLAGEFTFRGKRVFVIANHFASKGGDQALTSQYQPPTRSSETQRHAQATVVNSFAKDILKAQPDADVITLGDINDFEFSGTTQRLEDGGALWSAIKSLPKHERYTYDYQGNSQVLDQILISPSIVAKDAFGYDSVHINSEFHDQISDHDPQVLRFRP